MGIIQVASRPLYRPTYSAAAGGSLTDGGSATVTTTGLSTTVPTFELLKPWIEANAVNSHLIDKAGWQDGDIETDRGVFTHINNTRSYTGTKSLLALNDNADGRFGAAYSPGSTITSQFIGYYVYIDTVSVGGGQWKMVRWNNDGLVVDNAVSNSYCAQRQPWASDFYTVTSSGSGTSGVTFGIAFNRWHWVELYVEFETPGTSQGVFREKVWDTVAQSWVSDNTVTGINNYAGGASLKQFTVFQNYTGNGAGSPPLWENGDDIGIYMDANMILTNGSGQERWYFANASTWAAVTKFQLQRPTSQTSTVATFSNSVIQGELDFGQPVWAYKSDSSGNINATGLTVTPA